MTSRITLPGGREMSAFFLILANIEGFRGNLFYFVNAGCNRWLTSRLGEIQPSTVKTKPLLRQSHSDYQYVDMTI